MSKRRYILFAASAVGLAVFLVAAMLVVLDLYSHRKFQSVSLYNVWGYRGPVAPAKKPGEKRMVVLGGSTAYGYGVPFEKSFSFLLEKRLNRRRRSAGKGGVSVINLAWLNEGAYSLVYTLEDYAYLDYDVVLLYSGYNDLGEKLNKAVFRRESPLFRLTGYLPALPIVLREKALVLLHGTVGAGYETGGRTRFRPGLMARMKAKTLNAFADVASSLEAQLGPLTDPERVRSEAEGAGCGERWAHYCDSVHSALEYALSRGKRVLLVIQPYIGDSHVRQQAALVEMLRERFGSPPALHIADLGGALSVRDPEFAYDGMHLTEKGNERVADSLLAPSEKVLDSF